MDRVVLLGLDRAALVHRIAGHVEHAAHDPVADGHRDRPAGVDDFEAALEPFGAGHRDRRAPSCRRGAAALRASASRAGPGPCSPPSARCRSAAARRKFDVHHRTDDLNDLACTHSSSLRHSPRRPPDFQQLLRDVALTQLVVFERQVLDQALALSVAFFIDTMRALCSLALAFSSNGRRRMLR